MRASLSSVFSHFTWSRWFTPIVGTVISILTGVAIILLFSAVYLHALSSMTLLASMLYFKAHVLSLLFALVCCVLFGTIGGILYDKRCKNAPNTNIAVPTTLPCPLPDPHPRPRQFYGATDKVIVLLKGFARPDALPDVLKGALDNLNHALQTWLLPALRPIRPTPPSIDTFFASMHTFFSCLSPTSMARTGWSEHKQCLYRRLVWRVVSMYWERDIRVEYYPPSIFDFSTNTGTYGFPIARGGLDSRTYGFLHLLHNMTYVYEYFYEKRLQKFTPEFITEFKDTYDMLINSDTEWTSQEKARMQNTLEEARKLLSLNSSHFPLDQLIYQLDSLEYHHQKRVNYETTEEIYTENYVYYGGNFPEADWDAGEHFLNAPPPPGIVNNAFFAGCHYGVTKAALIIDFFQEACEREIQNLPANKALPFANQLMQAITDPVLKRNIMNMSQTYSFEPTTQQDRVALGGTIMHNNVFFSTKQHFQRLGLPWHEYYYCVGDTASKIAIAEFVLAYTTNLQQRQDVKTCAQDPTHPLYPLASIDIVKNSILSYSYKHNKPFTEDIAANLATEDIANPYPNIQF